MSKLHVGDTIQCYDTYDCMRTMQELAKEGVETDILYGEDGKMEKWGARLEVVEVIEDGLQERNNKSD